MEPVLLGYIEELLGLTEVVKDQLDHMARDRWLEISSEVADIRDDLDIEAMDEMEIDDE